MSEFATLHMTIAALTGAMSDQELRDKACQWRESLRDLGDDMACVLEDVIDRREALARFRERAS